MLQMVNCHDSTTPSFKISPDVKLWEVGSVIFITEHRTEGGNLAYYSASQYFAATIMLQFDTKGWTESKYANDDECIDQYHKQPV